MDSLRHIDKGATRPYSTVKSRKFVILWRNQLHKVFLYQILIIPQGSFHIRINHTLLYQIFLNTVIYHLRIILGTYASQGGLLCLWNTQAVKGGFNVLRYILPLAGHLGIRLYIGNDFIHVQLREIRTPGRQPHGVVYLQCLQAAFQHPLRIMLADRNIPYYILGKALLGFVGRVILIADVVQCTLYIINKSLVFCFHLNYLNPPEPLPQPAPCG